MIYQFFSFDKKSKLPTAKYWHHYTTKHIPNGFRVRLSGVEFKKKTFRPLFYFLI
jgi:hypothetical protein